jgi:hypothetical protein
MSHRPRIQARSNRWWGHDDGCPQMTAHLKEHDEVPEECPIGRKRAHKTAPRELQTCTKGRGARMLHARYHDSQVPTHRRPLARPHWCSTSATTLAGTPFTPRRGCATQFVARGGVDQARTPMVRKRCTPHGDHRIPPRSRRCQTSPPPGAPGLPRCGQRSSDPAP